MTEFIEETAAPVKKSFFSTSEGLAQVFIAEKILEIIQDSRWNEKIRKIDPAILGRNIVMGYGAATKLTHTALWRRIQLFFGGGELMPSVNVNAMLVAFLEVILNLFAQNIVTSRFLSNISPKLINAKTIGTTIVRLDGLF